MNHGISQIINNLKTANIAGKESAVFGFSKFRQAILEKLSALGFVGKVIQTRLSCRSGLEGSDSFGRFERQTLCEGVENAANDVQVRSVSHVRSPLKGWALESHKYSILGWRDGEDEGGGVFFQPLKFGFPHVFLLTRDLLCSSRIKQVKQ